MIRKRKNTLASGKVKTFYQAVVYFKGMVISRKSFDTMAQAVKYESETLKKCKLGKQGINEDYTFGMCVDDYKKTDYKMMRKSSQQTIESRFRYFSESPIKNTLMEEFSDRSIDEWLDWLLVHETASNPTRKNFAMELRVLVMVLNWYRENKDSSFVVPILKRHRKKSHYKPIKRRPAKYYMEPESAKRWLEYLKNNASDIVFYRVALFQVLTGCRIGEALGLCWDAVHLNAKKPYVQIIRTNNSNAKATERKIEEKVKTKNSVRTINLPDILVEEFRKIKVVEIDSYSPVFYLTKGPRLLTYSMTICRYHVAYRALKMPWSGSHLARHTAATLALLGGKSVLEVQAMLGHGSVKQTEDYAKIIALQDNEAPQKNAELLGF